MTGRQPRSSVQAAGASGLWHAAAVAGVGPARKQQQNSDSHAADSLSMSGIQLAIQAL